MVSKWLENRLRLLEKPKLIRKFTQNTVTQCLTKLEDALIKYVSRQFIRGKKTFLTN